MSDVKLQAARELIQEKRYDEARTLLRTVDHPTARQWLARIEERQDVNSAARTAARLKSYTAHAVVVFILYFVLFLPGLIANVIFHNEGKRMEALAGQPLPGVGALGLMRRWMFIAFVVVSVVLIVVLLIPLVTVYT